MAGIEVEVKSLQDWFNEMVYGDDFDESKFEKDLDGILGNMASLIYEAFRLFLAENQEGYKVKSIRFFNADSEIPLVIS